MNDAGTSRLMVATPETRRVSDSTVSISALKYTAPAGTHVVPETLTGVVAGSANLKYPGSSAIQYPGGGWVRATDPDSGYDYFYDPATGASAWAHELRPDPNDPTPRTTTAPAPSPRGGAPARHATTTVVERRPREHAADDDGGSDGGYDDDDSADDDDDDDDDECCCCCFGAPKPKHPYKAIELHAS